MTIQPTMQQFGAPPAAPTGMARLMPHIRTLAAGGALVTVIFMGAQVILPEGWRPSDIAGKAAGSAEKQEILAKQEAKVAFDRMVADSNAQAATKAQIDAAVTQKVLEERSQGLAAQTAMGGLADVLCLGSMVFGALGTQNTGADWHSDAASVAAATCGLGDTVRQNVTTSQIDAVRTVAAARGSSMNNGAISASTPPLDPDMKRILVAIDAVTTPSKHYDYAEVQKYQNWADKAPAWVQQHLNANLPSNSTGWDVFVDRARILDAAIHPS